MEILQTYSEKHSCIRVLTQANGGVSAARNTGLDNANGRYLAFVDADDFLIKGSLKVLCDELEKNDGDMIIFGYKNVSESDSYCEDDRCTGITVTRNKSGVTKSPATVWNNVIKRSIVEDNHIRFGVGLKYGEDFMFEGMKSMFVQSDRQLFANAKIYCYRQREGSAMHTRGEEKIYTHMNNMLSVIDEWNAFIDKHPHLSDERKTNIKDRIYLSSAAAIFDSLRIKKVDSYMVR